MAKLPLVKKPLWKPFDVKLSDDDKATFEQWLSARLDDAIQKTADRNSKIAAWRESYALAPYDRELPFDKASNVRIPVSRILTDQILLRLVQSHFGVTPYVRFKPKGSTPSQQARSLEQMLWHVHESSQKILAGFLAIKDAVLTGTGITKTVWDQDWRLVRDGHKKSYVLRYNYPRTVHVPTEDFVIYPTEATDIDNATIVGNRTATKLWDDLQRGVSTGLYNDKWVEEIRGKAAPINETNKYKHEESEMGVQASGVSAEDYPFELYELIVAYDLDDDGLAEDYLVTFEYSTRKVIRFIEYPAGYGERWYHVYVPIPVSDSLYGESIYNQTLSMDEEITTMHNVNLDNAYFINTPQYTGREGSPFWEDGQKAYPGRVWRVVEHDDLKVLSQGAALGPGFMQNEERLMYYAQLLLGVTELNAGMGSQGDKTAYEIEARLAEGSIRIRLEVTLGTWWLMRMAWQEVGLLKQFLPDGVFEEITGSPNFIADMKWEDMWSGFYVEPTGNTTTSNRELERQKIMMIREGLKNDPLLFDTDPMTGQVRPKPGWYEVAKRFLMANDIDDYQLILGPEPAQEQLQTPAQGQQLPTGASEPANPEAGLTPDRLAAVQALFQNMPQEGVGIGAEPMAGGV